MKKLLQKKLQPLLSQAKEAPAEEPETTEVAPAEEPEAGEPDEKKEV